MYESFPLRIHYINILQSVPIMKKNFTTFIILFIFFLMLALPSVTKQASNEGLNLWIFNVLPALLPYTIISSLLMQLNAFAIPCRLVGRIFKCTLPENEIFIIICGCLCGCPIGAKVAATSYKKGSISKTRAEFLMCTCNNLSPSFLINYIFVEVYAPFISLTAIHKYILFFIMLSSSLIGAFVVHIFFKTKKSYRTYPRINKKISESIKASSHTQKQLTTNQAATNKITTVQSFTNVVANKKPALSKLFEDCILSSFEIQAKIGGYIILFTIISNLFLQTLYLSDIQAAIFGSTLEITSGLGLFLSCGDSSTTIPAYFIIALITAFTTFGGICTIFQTKTAISDSGLSIKKYGISKLIAGCVAFLLSIVLIN